MLHASGPGFSAPTYVANDRWYSNWMTVGTVAEDTNCVTVQGTSGWNFVHAEVRNQIFVPRVRLAYLVITAFDGGPVIASRIRGLGHPSMRP
jgi:hypothetical protein